MGLNLGLAAYTTASHIILVVVVFLVFHEAQRLIATQGSFSVLAHSAFVRWSIFTVFAALILERLYYITARLLRPYGFDLWQQHPAPEVLSFSVALALFSLSAAGRIAVAPSFLAAARPVFRNAVVLTLVYALVVYLLY